MYGAFTKSHIPNAPPHKQGCLRVYPEFSRVSIQLYREGEREMPDIFKKRCTVLSGHPEKCPKITNTASLSQGRLSRIGAKNE